MAKGDRRNDIFRLFSRPKRPKHGTRPRATRLRGGPRITDALGATRMMRPNEPHLQVAERRIRFSLSFLACGTLAVAFLLLLLVAFVVGMRYQTGRAAPARTHPPGTVARETTPAAPRTTGMEASVRVGILGTEHSPAVAPTAAKRFRLRIATYSSSKRDLAEESASALRLSGVPVVLETDRRNQVVIYSQERFDSPTSPRALALLRKVQKIKHKDQYAFSSAYLVEER